MSAHRTLSFPLPYIEASWLKISTRGPLPGVCSRKGSGRKIFGLLTDDPALSAAQLIRRDESHGAVEQFFRDSK
jgi:hypothetical protein